MGVSMIGQANRAAQARYILATMLVFGTLFYFFYGPPLTKKFREAAMEQCNQLTGGSYRTYRLEWRTTTYKSIDVPHWTCFDTQTPEKPPVNLGWWVGV